MSMVSSLFDLVKTMSTSDQRTLHMAIGDNLVYGEKVTSFWTTITNNDSREVLSPQGESVIPASEEPKAKVIAQDTPTQKKTGCYTANCNITKDLKPWSYDKAAKLAEFEPWTSSVLPEAIGKTMCKKCRKENTDRANAIFKQFTTANEANEKNNKLRTQYEELKAKTAEAEALVKKNKAAIEAMLKAGLTEEDAAFKATKVILDSTERAFNNNKLAQESIEKQLAV